MKHQYQKVWLCSAIVSISLLVSFSSFANAQSALKNRNNSGPAAESLSHADKSRIPGTGKAVNTDPLLDIDSAESVNIEGNFFTDENNAAAGITDHSNVRSFRLFPDSGIRKYVLLSVEALHPINNALLTLTNMAGKVVFSRQFQKPGKSIFEEITLPELPSGNYLIRFKSDDEFHTRCVRVR